VDGGLWIELQDQLKLQVEEAFRFHSMYGGLDSAKKELENLSDFIQKFNARISTRLERLMTMSQELIQTVCLRHGDAHSSSEHR
jgi:hypothetical protein